MRFLLAFLLLSTTLQAQVTSEEFRQLSDSLEEIKRIVEDNQRRLENLERERSERIRQVDNRLAFQSPEVEKPKLEKPLTFQDTPESPEEVRRRMFNEPSENLLDPFAPSLPSNYTQVIEPQTRLPVNTRAVHMVRHFGSAKVINLIWANGKPIPVPNVVYGGSPPPSPQPTPQVSNFGNFGN